MLCTHIPAVSCFFSDAAGSAHTAPAAHFEYQMILATGGRARLIVNRKTYEILPRSLVFISRLEEHRFIIEEAYTRYVASISSELIMSAIKDPELISIFIQHPRDFCHVIALDDDVYQTLLPHFVTLTREYQAQKQFFTTRGVGLVTAILIDLYRARPECFPIRTPGGVASSVLSAQYYISEHFHRKLTIREVAEASFISSHALSLAFRDVTGITFKEYLLLFRVAESKKLLITTNLPIEEIAGRVGYINVNNFIKIFKEREKITPLQYRRQFASSDSHPNLHSY